MSETRRGEPVHITRGEAALAEAREEKKQVRVGYLLVHLALMDARVVGFDMKCADSAHHSLTVDLGQTKTCVNPCLYASLMLTLALAGADCSPDAALLEGERVFTSKGQCAALGHAELHKHGLGHIPRAHVLYEGATNHHAPSVSPPPPKILSMHVAMPRLRFQAPRGFCVLTKCTNYVRVVRRVSRLLETCLGDCSRPRRALSRRGAHPCHPGRVTPDAYFSRT